MQSKPKKNIRKRRLKKDPRARLWRGVSKFLIFWLIAIGMAGLALYVAFLDYTIRSLFEGKRWAIPAYVYASPIELYAGLALSPESFEAELRRLRYRRDPTLSTEASYVRQGSEFKVKTRAFRFGDQDQPAHSIELGFSNNTLHALSDLTTHKEVAILRMDPAQIGSFYPTHNEDRILVKLDQVPKRLIQTLLATEDRDFYEHHGISLKSIARAIFANFRAGDLVQGGSTITQQLVKNFYLSSERTLWRKLNEALMAIILEIHYPKDEILEAYLNEIYLGQEGQRAIHGFGLASQYYFDRSITDLELHHMALLVALVKGASYYDPRHAPQRAKQRRDFVLDGMANLQKISAREANSAKAKPLDVSRRGRRATTQYPAFMDLVRRQLKEQYRDEDLTSEGLKIMTTLQLPVQQALEEAAVHTLSELEKSGSVDKLQVAGVVTSREGGDIVALLGGRNPRFAGFNRALDIQRLIGSLVKPAIYLTALEDSQRYNVLTPLEDTEVSLQSGGKTWSPKNFDLKEHGVVSLNRALTHSYNLATVHLGLDVGIGRVVKTLHSLGIERDIPKYPSILLGALELSPLEVTQMYQTLAGDGFITPLRAIRAVIANDGTALQRYPISVRQVLDPAAVFLTNVLLQQVMREGTGRSVYATLPSHLNVAGKTGTTNDLKDSWFAGYSGDYLAAIWIGRDDNQSTGLSGSSGALKVWTRLMQESSKQGVELVVPESVEWVAIDRNSGLRAGASCENTVQYPFIAGTAPERSAPCAEASRERPAWYQDWFQ